MSIQAMTLVLDFAPDHWTSGTRLVALALADRVNQDWQAWPSLDDMARRTGLSTRQVRTHLKQLESERVIVSTVRRREGGKRQPNLWTWMWRICVQPVDKPRRNRKPTSASTGSPLHSIREGTTGSPLPQNPYIEPTYESQAELGG